MGQMKLKLAFADRRATKRTDWVQGYLTCLHILEGRLRIQQTNTTFVITWYGFKQAMIQGLGVRRLRYFSFFRGLGGYSSFDMIPNTCTSYIATYCIL